MRRSTIRDQVTTQSNIPVSNLVLLNSVDKYSSFKVIAVEHEVSLLEKWFPLQGERGRSF